MSTQKLNNMEEITNKFKGLFEKTDEEFLDHRAHMLSFIFLSEAEKVMERNGISKKTLAEKIGTSASYLTQLFRGDRLLNLKTIARIEKALDLKYVVSEESNTLEEKERIRVHPDKKLPSRLKAAAQGDLKKSELKTSLRKVSQTKNGLEADL